MKTKVFKAPAKVENPNSWPSVFLAGAIDTGKAEDWQKELTKTLSDVECVILNPRRDNLDSSWEQSIENKKFREQVEWELKGLEDATLVVMGLTKDSKAPISLLELGLHVVGRRMIVYCPEGFYRKGNIDIVCKRYGVPVYEDFDEFCQNVKARMLETIAGSHQEETLPSGTFREQKNRYVTAARQYHPDNKNHKDFDNKRDALRFLESHPLMSVGWPEGQGRKEACYWNGKVYVTKADIEASVSRWMTAGEFVAARYRAAKTAVYRPIQMVKPWTDADGNPVEPDEMQMQPLRRRPDYGEIEMEIEKRMKEQGINKTAVARELTAVARELWTLG